MRKALLSSALLFLACSFTFSQANAGQQETTAAPGATPAAAAPRLKVPLLLLTGFPVGVLADLLQQAFGVAITGVQAEGGFALVKSGLRPVQ